MPSKVTLDDPLFSREADGCLGDGRKRTATPGILKFGFRTVGCNSESLKRWISGINDGEVRSHVQINLFSST